MVIYWTCPPCRERLGNISFEIFFIFWGKKNKTLEVLFLLLLLFLCVWTSFRPAAKEPKSSQLNDVQTLASFLYTPIHVYSC